MTLLRAGRKRNALPLAMVLLALTARGRIAEAQAPAAAADGGAAAAGPSIAAATIKPNNSGDLIMENLTIEGRNFVTVNSSLGDLIAFAYKVQVKQIAGAPDWLDRDRYDLRVAPDGEGMLTLPQAAVMVKQLLADRFKLTFHHETREMPAYLLTVAKNGPKLPPPASPGAVPTIGFRPAPNGLTLLDLNGPLGALASLLQIMVLDRPVVDQTGISGRFDVQLTFTPDSSEFKGRPMAPPADPASAAPGLFDAIQQQLGLKLTAQKAQVDVLAIDHVEKPTPN